MNVKLNPEQKAVIDNALRTQKVIQDTLDKGGRIIVRDRNGQYREMLFN